MNKEYILNPDYIFRNDKSRVLLYSKNPNENWKCYLHPIQAMALSFFREKKVFSENIHSLALAFGISDEYAFKIMSPFIENHNFLVVNWNGNKIKFPPNMLVDSSCLDTEYSFCDIDSDYLKCDNLDLKTKRCLLAPISMTIILINTCVTNCCYCYADKRPRTMQILTTERILSIIEEAYNLKMKSLLLIGGEVFLHKDWKIILRKVIEKGFYVRPLSTKIPISDSIIKDLNEVGYRSIIQLSIDTIDSHLIEKILGANAVYLKKIKAGIQLLDKSNIKYQIVTVITRYNVDFHYIKELFIYLSSLINIVSWRITPAFKSAYMNNDSYKKIKAPRNDIEILFNRIRTEIMPYTHFDVILDLKSLTKNFYKGKHGCKSFHGGVCGILNDEIIVLPDGKVTVCDQLYWNEKFIIGDLTLNSIKDVWNSNKSQELLEQKQILVSEKSACKKCEIFDSCFIHRCWSDVIKAYGDDNMDYPDPRCIKAPAMLNDISY